MWECLHKGYTEELTLVKAVRCDMDRKLANIHLMFALVLEHQSCQ